MGWGEDGLHKRGKTWYISYRDNGRLKEKTTRKSDYKEAQKFQAVFMERLRRGELSTEMADWTLQMAADKYNEWRQATANRRTATTERTLLRALIAFFGNSNRLRTFSPQGLREYQVHRLQHINPKTKRAVGPRTINYELSLLKRILTRANLWYGPLASEYKRLRQPKSTCGKALSPEGAQQLFAVAVQKDAWQVAFLCALLAKATGCRCWEIKTLQLGSINFDAAEFIVRAEYAKNRQQRTVALNEIGTWALKKLLDRARIIGASLPSHFLLPHNLSRHTLKDDPLCGSRGFDVTRHQSHWASAWRSLRKKAGMQDFRFHDLRHTFVTEAAEADVPIAVTQAIVGHLTPEMTQYYTHIRTRATRDAVKRIGEANEPLWKFLMKQEANRQTGK